MKPIEKGSKAYEVLLSINHVCGIASAYIGLIDKLSQQILYFQDDMGMDDATAIDSIRLLDMLKKDITTLANDSQLRAYFAHQQANEEELAGIYNRMRFVECQLPETDQEADQEDLEAADEDSEEVEEEPEDIG